MYFGLNLGYLVQLRKPCHIIWYPPKPYELKEYYIPIIINLVLILDMNNGINFTWTMGTLDVIFFFTVDV